MRMLLDLLPKLLVEPGRVPGSCHPYGRLPLDGGLPGTSTEQSALADAAIDVGYKQDTYKAHRMEKMQNELSLYRCHTIFNCARTCPKGLNPAAAIAKMKLELAAE